MRREVMLNWMASNMFGWGIVGLNLMQRWASDEDIQPLMALPIKGRDLQGFDPLRLAAMEPAVAASNQFLEQFHQGGMDLRQRGLLVMDPVGNGFRPPGIRFDGAAASVGRCVFENTRIEKGREYLKRFDSLLCASQWNAALLRTISDTPVTIIHEGIDHSLFFPGPRSDALDPGRFYVFSGGKVEFRKAQDLVLLAFREFAARHDDAVLVACWHTFWPQTSAGFQGKLPVPLHQNSSGALEFRRWAVENGVKTHQFMDLPPMPNSLMPMVLREMDCALQVSRSEACTNLPAKEAMACGLPTILADNTGMRDLIDDANCLALRDQGRVTDPGWGTEAWGESSVDEIVAALERLYTDRELRKNIGSRGARWVIENHRTWKDHAAALKAYLLQLF